MVGMDKAMAVARQSGIEPKGMTVVELLIATVILGILSAIADRFDTGEAAVRFLEAGGDLALICHNTERQRAAVEAVEKAVQSGRLSEARLAASLERIALLREWVGTHRTPVNVQTARAFVGSADHQQLLQAFSKAVGHSPLP